MYKTEIAWWRWLNKLTRMMQYLLNTKELTLTLEPNKHPNWFLDRSHLAHKYCGQDTSWRHRVYLSLQQQSTKITKVQFYQQKTAKIKQQTHTTPGRELFFVADKIKKGEVKVEFCPTHDMLRDLFTKPLQSTLFIHVRERYSHVQECVGKSKNWWKANMDGKSIITVRRTKALAFYFQDKPCHQICHGSLVKIPRICW